MNHEDGYTCAGCHEDYSLRENCEPSEYCDRCVHDVLDETKVQLSAALAKVAELESSLDVSRQRSEILQREREEYREENARLRREVEAWERMCKRVAEMGGVDVKVCNIEGGQG